MPFPTIIKFDVFCVAFYHYCASLVFQVIDTPKVVNPEWKYFIPGYLYNDSDLELTAESFYRQDKLILYVFRWLCFVRTPLRHGALAGD